MSEPHPVWRLDERWLELMLLALRIQQRTDKSTTDPQARQQAVDGYFATCQRIDDLRRETVAREAAGAPVREIDELIVDLFGPSIAATIVWPPPR